MEAGDVQLAQAFDCGTPALNEWFQRYAWQNHNGGGARTYVLIDQDSGEVAGYFCLSAASAEYKSAPAGIQKGLARHPVPVVLIGRLAVDRRYRGHGLGRFLVRDAIMRTVEAADRIAVRAIMVQAKNSEAAAFYERLGFVASEGDPLLFFMTLKDAKKSLAEVAKT